MVRASALEYGDKQFCPRLSLFKTRLMILGHLMASVSQVLENTISRRGGVTAQFPHSLRTAVVGRVPGPGASGLEERVGQP